MRAFTVLAAIVSASLLSTDDASFNLKERPVSKVLNMLGKMQEELAAEKEADQNLYDKLSCWCETNGKNKNAAVVTANNRIESLTADIEGGTAKSADLRETIATLEAEIAKADGALRKSSAMRAKDLGEFNADEKDLMQSIQALGNAVVVLGKHHESFMQTNAKVQLPNLKHALARAHISHDQKAQVEAFLQQPAGFSSYAPASGQIFGILKQMKEAKARVDAKSQELAETEEQLAQNKQIKSDTIDALDADTKFLLDLKQRCANADAEFDSRTKARNEEVVAVADTIALLNSDEAHDLFGKTMGFVQLKAVSNSRARAMKALQAAAHRTGSFKLARLAQSVQLDAFAKVQESINVMISELKTQQSDEVKHRDFCIEEFAENDKMTAINQDELSDLGSHIETLKSNLDTLTTDLADANAEIAETKTQMQRASEDREAENSEFQTTVSDQRAAQKILTFALNRLKEVYNLAQVSNEPGAAAPAMPEGFTDYSQNKHSGGVVGMIQTIIDDSKTMEMDALRAENDSQAAYESYTKNGNASIKALMEAVNNKSGMKADADADRLRSMAGHSSTLKALEALNTYKGTLHKSCDYVMENFSARQEAREQEWDALGQAKSILQGAG